MDGHDRKCSRLGSNKEVIHTTLCMYCILYIRILKICINFVVLRMYRCYFSFYIVNFCVKEFIQISITEILESVSYLFNFINLVYHNYCKLRNFWEKKVDFRADDSVYRK